MNKKPKLVYSLQTISMFIFVPLLFASLIFHAPANEDVFPAVGGDVSSAVSVDVSHPEKSQTPTTNSEIITDISSPALSSQPAPKPVSKVTGATDPNKVVECAFVPAPEGMERKIYLTFDDGPSPITPQILQILKQRKVKATFFVIKHTDPKVVPAYKQITDGGHTIALHSASHAYRSIYASVDDFWTDFEEIREYVKKLTGVDTRLFRFPGGASNTIWKFHNRNQIIADVNRRGDVYFDWNVSSGDANKNGGPSSETMAANVIRDISKLEDPRAVVLFHDGIGKINTVNALPRIIDTLKEKGYTFDTVDKIIDYPVHHRLKD